MRTVIQEHLDDLERDLIIMSKMVITAIQRSVTALKEQDQEEAVQIKKDDKQINEIRWEIEEKAIKLIATQQPVARDLRKMIAILNIITDLERMGDHAGGIASITLKLGDGPSVKPLIDIPRMAEISVGMIENALTAYKERDERAARAIHKQDDQIDDLYNQIIRELVSIMIEDPKTITRCTYLIWVAHNLERIGDRVTNICERIIYLVTGKMIGEITEED
ncbi:MAG: phosphate signaling complex protein PhoU [Balneolaceae bacterium]